MSGNIDQTYEHHQVVSSDDIDYHHSDEQGHLRENDMMEEYSEKAAPPQKPRFYKRKRYWVICAINTVIITVVAVVLALYVIFPKVAQSLMNQSHIDVTAADISFTKPDALNGQTYSKRDGDDMNSTFYMNMQSALSNTGPFSASINFHNPIEVYYNDTLLGNIFLYNQSHISGGHGQLNAITPFVIKDQTAFASFAKSMLAVDTFVWTLKGKLDISALTRTATVDLNKDIVLNGFNSFPDVKINSFQLPGDDPNGGILVELGTVLNSPSPIGVQLGTIAMAVGYQGVKLGNVTAQGVTLQKGDNNITLKGTLVPQKDNASLALVGDLFSNYISGTLSNTTATGLSCAPDGVNPVTWLSSGFESVNLNVALGAPSPLKIINGVSMGYLDLKFDPNAPYSPVANAPNVTANFQLPFGFSLNITQLSQNITLAINTSSTQTANFAVMQVPSVAAVSDQKSGTIKFGLANIAIAGIPGQEGFYNQFTYALTSSDNYTFMIQGNANTQAVTPIGPLNLRGINFTVPTTLQGLRFLNSTPTTISSLDVTGGTTAGLSLAIGVAMENPSDFSISTGDVSFNMGASGTNLGLVTLSNLTLVRGNNSVNASASFDPKSSDVGQNLLSTFIMGKDNGVDITGYANSTNIASLAAGLSAITLSSTLPGLKTALIQGAAMSVLPDTLQTSNVGVKVAIANPFTAGLSISKIVSAATFAGMPVGNINQDISSNPFTISGKTVGTSNSLNMAMNLEPAAVALLLRTLAVQANMDTKALDALLGLGGFSIAGQESVTPDSNVFANFNVSQYVLDAMKALKVDLSVTSTTSIGQYTDDLSFAQASVAVATDNSITQLIPIVGQPIVQQIVDGSVLAFDTIVLSAITESSMTVQLKGSVTKAGPIEAIISFPSPLTVSWQGKVIGTVNMASIDAKPNVGASFDVPGTFTVANSDDMAAFSAYLINSDSFEWEVTSNDVSVSALGFTFNKISLNKFVTLAGASGFKNDISVTSFDLPSNDPAGGITINVNTVIKNPSQIGFNLGGVGFENYFGSVDLGPLASAGAASFPPQGSANIAMKGRLIPQTSQEGIVAITTVFGHYLAGQSSTLTVKGISASGSNGPVSWLTSAFKTLTINNITLPGPSTIPTLIPAITMKDLEMDFTKDPWNPPTSSKNVEAQIKNPFGFPLGVSELNMKVEATYQGQEVASLDVPNNAATTSPTGLVSTSFSNVPFAVANKQLFAGFVELLTASPSLTFGLQGTSNAVAQTAVGTLTLPGITFNVDTTLAGFADFGGKAVVQSLTVVGATSEYVMLNLTVQLTNPSQITITIGDVNFDALLPAAGNARVGRVYMYGLTISPGAQSYSAVMHLGEAAQSAEAVGALLTGYLTGVSAELTIQGTTTSTNIAPLAPALSTVKLSSTVAGINAGLIQFINVSGEFATMVFPPYQATADITLYNPLDAPFKIVSIDASTGKYIDCAAADPTGQYTGKFVEVGSIHYTLPEPLLIPPKTTVTAYGWPVNVNQDVNAVVPSIFGDKHYNVTQNASIIVGDGFADPSFYYFQNNVPFAVNIDAFAGADLSCPVAAQSIINGTTPTNSTSTNTTATTTVPSSTSSTVTLTILTTTQAESSTTAAATTTTVTTTTVDSTSTATTAPSVTAAAATTPSQT